MQKFSIVLIILIIACGAARAQTVSANEVMAYRLCTNAACIKTFVEAKGFTEVKNKKFLGTTVYTFKAASTLNPETGVTYANTLVVAIKKTGVTRLTFNTVNKIDYRRLRQQFVEAGFIQTSGKNALPVMYQSKDYPGWIVIAHEDVTKTNVQYTIEVGKL